MSIRRYLTGISEPQGRITLAQVGSKIVYHWHTARVALGYNPVFAMCVLFPMAILMTFVTGFIGIFEVVGSKLIGERNNDE